MALGVYDLAVEVFLYLVGFQRRVEDGEEVSYEDTRKEVLTLLSDLDKRSHGEPGLWENWRRAINPIVYLIDEVMIINCQWRHKDEWANDCLEVKLLGHPVALGGESFYTESDEALKELERAEAMNRQDIKARQEIVMIFYVAMQLGFKGKFALDPNAWREYKLQVFTKLPAFASTRTRELFADVTKHTDKRPIVYTYALPLIYVGIFVVVAIVVDLFCSHGLWEGMVGVLKEKQQIVTDAAAAAATSMPSRGG